MYLAIDTRRHQMMHDAARPFAVVSLKGNGSHVVISRHETRETARAKAARLNRIQFEPKSVSIFR